MKTIFLRDVIWLRFIGTQCQPGTTLPPTIEPHCQKTTWQTSRELILIWKYDPWSISSSSTVSSTAGMSVGQHECSSLMTSLKLTPSRWLASGIRLGLQVDKTFTLPILSNNKSVKRGKESPTRLSSVLLACPKVPLKPIDKKWHSCQSVFRWVW